MIGRSRRAGTPAGRVRALHHPATLLVLLILVLVTAGPAEAQSTGGAYVADLGFRAGVHGFSFENYGRAPDSDLKADDLRRLFGDQVCASTASGRCTLTPAGKEWMAKVNSAMQGGHCEGLAVLSLLMYLGKAAPEAFGGSTANQLLLPGNEALQREIAYWWATQATVPAGPSEITTLTPSEVLDTLIDAFDARGESFTLGVLKRTAPRGGHAILPWAVQDRGGGLFWIMVYDNNWPNAELHVEVDRGADTWRYVASTNPSEPGSLYEGDAGTFTLTLTPTSPRLLQQTCPFCAPGPNAASGGFNQLWLEGDGHILLTDGQGRRYGYDGGQLVREIPGVKHSFAKTINAWDDDDDPMYYVPVGLHVAITIDGSELSAAGEADLILIGPGYDLAVEGIELAPGQKDMVVFSPGPDGGTVSYQTLGTASPDIVFGIETDAADYAFTIAGVDLPGGGTITATLDVAAGQLKVAAAGSQGIGTYEIAMDRYTDDAEETFWHDAIELAPGDTAYLDFGSWQGDGSSLPLGIDRESDGSIDDTVELTDS